MKVEILDLWGLLFYENHIRVDKMQVVGDSKMIVDQVNRKCTLQVLFLESWELKIKELQEGFQELHLSRIYKEFNILADSLSKETLALEEGSFLVNYFVDNFLVSKEVLHIFRSLQLNAFLLFFLYKELEDCNNVSSEFSWFFGIPLGIWGAL